MIIIFKKKYSLTDYLSYIEKSKLRQLFSNKSDAKFKGEIKFISLIYTF